MSKKTKNKKSIFSKVSGRLTRMFVGGVFVVIALSMIVAFAMGAFMSSFWSLDNYGSVIMYTFIVLVISLVVGTGLAVAYSQIMIKVTSPYIKALQRVSRCDFSVRVTDNKLTTGLGIAENFNEMVSHLERVETLHENFISDFSHEFKTPIVSVAGFASLLKNPNLSVAERNEYLDVIIDESNRLVKLSESVLMLSRLDGQVVTKEEYRLDEQLRQCVLMFATEAKQRNIELELDLKCDNIVGCANLNRQIWVNLLSNAFKFTPDGGKITIKAKTSQGKVEVSVADNGCGMDEETMRDIFNKFYQGDKSRTTPGNGLGLAIVKKIIELQKGEIRVDSQPNKGSVFTVILQEK